MGKLTLSHICLFLATVFLGGLIVGYCLGVSKGISIRDNITGLEAPRTP